MKCEHCGNEEVSFHYTSNINGNITEKHLCSQCAGKFGIDNLDFSGEEKKDAINHSRNYLWKSSVLCRPDG